MIVSSAANAAAASGSGPSEWFPAPLVLYLLLSLAAQPGTPRLSRLRTGRLLQSSERCSPGGRVRPLGLGQPLLAGAWEPCFPC